MSFPLARSEKRTSAALLGTCPPPANCISRGLLFSTFCCRSFCLPMLTPPAYPSVNNTQLALTLLLPQASLHLSANTKAELWDDTEELQTCNANNRPEVTRMISLPPLTRVSSCSTRAPSRPRASLLSCPLVTQAVPICMHSTLRLRL